MFFGIHHQRYNNIIVTIINNDNSVTDKMSILLTRKTQFMEHVPVWIIYRLTKKFGPTRIEF